MVFSNLEIILTKKRVAVQYYDISHAGMYVCMLNFLNMPLAVRVNVELVTKPSKSCTCEYGSSIKTEQQLYVWIWNSVSKRSWRKQFVGGWNCMVCLINHMKPHSSKIKAESEKTILNTLRVVCGKWLHFMFYVLSIKHIVIFMPPCCHQEID